MKKKIISILIILGVILGIIFSIPTNAGTGKLYTNLAALNLDGIGYAIGNPANQGKNIWHMSTYNSTNGDISEKQKNIYCLKGEYGGSWEDFDYSSVVLEYNMVFDLQTDREKLSSKLVDIGNDSDDVVQALLNENGTQYRQILWLLDNMYIIGEIDREQYLAQIGLEKEEYEGVVTYRNSITGKEYGEELLTDADIMAIQRVAIWTFTNGGDFDKTGNTHWLRITTDATNYNTLSDSREAMAVDLYNYLVDSAKTGASLYTAENNYTITEAPVEVNVESLTQENGKYKMIAENYDSNYLIGPIVIDKNNDMLYEIKMIVTDENGAEIDSSKYSLTDVNGTPVENVVLKDFAGDTDGFYIKLAKSLSTNVNVQIQIGYYNTTKNLWLRGTETTEQVTLNVEQPVAEFSREPRTTTINIVAEPELTEIPVTKTWDDNNDQDGIRPEKVEIILNADGIEADRIEVTGTGNTWTGTFTNLPVKNNGKEIAYTIDEVLPEGYEKIINGYTITNTHNPEIKDIPVTKIWDDNNDQDGIRPEKIEIILYADGVEIDRVEATGTGNTWIGTFTNLPVKKEGKEIKYTIDEVLPEGYEKEVNGFTITNTHNPEIKDIPITKTWDDNNDQDGIRPEKVEIILYADGIEANRIEVTGTGNTWTGTFTNLPVKNNGKEIVYTIDEVLPEEYEKEVNGFMIINKYTPAKKEIPVTKIWNDNNNQDGIRPEKVEIILYADEVEVDRIEVTGTGNTWTGTFTNLPVKKEGKEIVYTIDEVLPQGYEKTINGYTATNTHTPETKDIPVTKTWDDNNNQDGIRPEKVEIILYADGVEVDRTEVTGTGNTWTGTFTNLPVKNNGKEIVYTIDEVLPEEYEKEVNGFMIINKYTPAKKEIPVTKIWNDNNNQDGIRPEKVEIILYADEVEVDRIEVTGTGNTWTGTFTNLPVKKEGKEINYTIDEVLPEGYEKTINGYTITNTHEILDLALRKYITKINEVSVTDTRVPNIEEETLETGTTIKYKHRKNSVQVQTGDTVTYSITVYNQGEKNGYASQIIDQLPTGLKYISGTTVESKDASGVVKNTYVATYDETTNKVIFDIINSTENEVKELQEYVTGNLDNETIEIECKVIAEASKEKSQTLTNVAWISELYDTEDDKVKESETNPNVNKDNMEDYKGKDTNKEDLSDSSYYYEGQQDDDDFEKVMIQEAPKEFDLALRKYIIKLNNNELTTLGLSTRVPDISKATLESGATATYRHRKDPVEVEENDIITYAISIYNEGEKASFATQIIDQLPEGLIYNPSTTVVSKDARGAEKNTYIATYEVSTNKVIFNIVNTTENPAKELQPYQEGNLDSETIEIKCKVIYKAKAGGKNILTNVAWINEAYDVEDGKTITMTGGEDRDSEPGTIPNVNKDNMENYCGSEENKKDLTDSTYHYKGQQDNDDFEKLYVKTFDLSLRKFISSINGKKLDVSREPIVDVTPLIKGTDTTAIYTHPKTALGLKVGDTVIYTIRVYNEGEINGYASKVKDYLPQYLGYVENSAINKKYEWSISEDGRLATTTYLLDKEIKAFNRTELDYEDLQIECKISGEAIPHEGITNIAEISEYKYGDIVYPEDIDSKSENIDENMSEDDNDFEKAYAQEFDFALRKFITEVQGKEITTRVPQVKIENETISYEHTKDALAVHVGDVVIYTLRIYNEGEIDGYASEITDDIPEYLEYLPEDSTNVEYMWKMYDENGNEIENVEEAVKVKTGYLSKENVEDNMIKAFDGKTLSFKDVKVAFKVKDPNSNTHIITNCAQISDDTDEDGKEIKDKDSDPDDWNEEDDGQDIENIKVEYFDLSILKFVSKVIVIEDGIEKITETGYNGHENPDPVVKVEIHKKKLDEVVVKFGYGITVTNEGDIPGYATEITDYVPEGLKFQTADNSKWTDEGNNVISTKQLENTLLQPGESKTIEVILTWVNDSENLAERTNTVEISEDKNEDDVPDRDSTPDNKQQAEDDMDIAKAILAISTGRTQTYFTLTLGLLAIIATGIALIKRFVL